MSPAVVCMSIKSICALAVALPLLAATPAVACDSDDYGYDCGELFPYKPFHAQIEGGATITQGLEGQFLTNGSNVGLGFTWQPESQLPLALRADATYQRFDARPALLTQATAYFGKQVDEGSVKMWGGDVDAELDLKVAYWGRLYLLAGGGWYDEQNSFRQETSPASGTSCSAFSCSSGADPRSTLIGRTTTGVRFAANAGIGVEIANGEAVTLFVDARYVRFRVGGANMDFIPIRVGIRF
jgi:opacity protein-like surface antigen